MTSNAYRTCTACGRPVEPAITAEDGLCAACHARALVLDAAAIENRLRIIAEVDAAECAGCQKTVPAGAHKDPVWFIDSHLEYDSANPDGYELADIRCPECW